MIGASLSLVGGCPLDSKIKSVRLSAAQRSIMAKRDESRAPTLGKRKHMETAEDQTEEIEIEKLKSELQEMAQRVIDYRKSMPDLLTKALRSNLAAMRLIISPSLDVTASTEVNITEEGLVPKVDDGIKEKLRIFREKSERNIAATHNKSKRLKDCIVKINKIQQFSVNVHPVFKML